MDGTAIRGIAFLAAVLPALVVATYFLIGARVRLDNHKIWAGFGFGACSAFPAVVIATLYDLYVGHGTGLYSSSISRAFIGAAIPEELFKFIAVLCLLDRRRQDSSPAHVFALAVATACGFACFENIFYVIESRDWSATAILRSVSAVPGHAFVGAIMGFCCARALRQGGRFYWWILALMVPIALHGIYNAPLFALSEASGELQEHAIRVEGFLVYLFIAVVIVEGLLAHFCLRAVAGTDRANHHDGEERPNIAGHAQRIGEHPASWALLGFACLCAAASFAWGPLAELEIENHVGSNAGQMLREGFAAFAVLHAAAFLSLAVVVRRRG